MALHHGDIHAEPTNGRGALVLIALPLHSPTAPGEGSPDATAVEPIGLQV